jgi:hypothetical protein
MQVSYCKVASEIENLGRRRNVASQRRRTRYLRTGLQGLQMRTRSDDYVFRGLPAMFCAPDQNSGRLLMDGAASGIN